MPVPSGDSISVIGVDPGLRGAIALLNGKTLSVFDIPTNTVKQGGKSRTKLDGAAFYRLVTALCSLGVDKAIVEKVGGISKQSASASFNFGAMCGAIEMAFIAAGIPVEKVAPQSWQAQFRLIGKDKTASRQLASTTFPEHASLFARVKDDGRAEAALIAKFGRDRS